MRKNPEYTTQHSTTVALPRGYTGAGIAGLKLQRHGRIRPFLIALLLVLSAGLATAMAATGPFPVTIDHKFGVTVIPREPSRVVTIGYTKQDPVLALGVTPLAVREWFGDQPHAVWPWAREALGDAQPQVLRMPFGELDYEAIAVLQPDLIIATHSGIQEAEYQRLARIAPTVAQPGSYPDFGVPWQEQARLLETDVLIFQVLPETERAQMEKTPYTGSLRRSRRVGPSSSWAWMTLCTVH